MHSCFFDRRRKVTRLPKIPSLPFSTARRDGTICYVKFFGPLFLRWDPRYVSSSATASPTWKATRDHVFSFHCEKLRLINGARVNPLLWIEKPRDEILLVFKCRVILFEQCQQWNVSMVASKFSLRHEFFPSEKYERSAERNKEDSRLTEGWIALRTIILSTNSDGVARFLVQGKWH